jgi:hypothetical protein
MRLSLALWAVGVHGGCVDRDPTVDRVVHAAVRTIHIPLCPAPGRIYGRDNM